MSPASSSVLRVCVVGPPGGGKSSLIKRIVSHRFDNMPTRNADFMGHASDGKYVNMIAVPLPFGKLGAAGPSHVLLEMQDQLDNDAYAQLNEPFWFKVAETPVATRDLEGLSPRSKMVAATSAMAARGAQDRTTEHWSKRLDRRAARQQASSQQTAATAAIAAHKDSVAHPQAVLQGVIPELPAHPLMQTTFDENARQSKQERREHDQVSPLTAPHGTHGWLIVFDLCSRESFEAAAAMAEQLMGRLGYDRTQKRACPVTVALVGNKHDTTARSKRSAVPPEQMVELLAKYLQPGVLVSQLRKQKVDRPLLKLIDGIISERKRIEESWQSAGGGARADKGEDKAEDIAGISSATFRAIVKVRNELDTMRVGRSHAPEEELLRGLLAALEHPLAEKSDPPAADLAEALFACPALGIKYLEVSCKTNHQIHLLERVALRSMRLLPTPDGAVAPRAAGAGADAAGAGADASASMGPLEYVGSSLSSLFGVSFGGGGVDCLARGKGEGTVEVS